MLDGAMLLDRRAFIGTVVAAAAPLLLGPLGGCRREGALDTALPDSDMDRSAAEPAACALVYDPLFLEHRTPPGHPERPARLTAILDRLEADGLLHRLLRLRARSCEDEDLLRCHLPGYLEQLELEVRRGRHRLSTGDVSLSERTPEIARRAAGGAMAAVDAVCRRSARRAFAALRPPGHHATPQTGMGFCIFNNAAIAARYAQAMHGIERVLIADWDVHHGNGTQDIFEADPTVFFFSTHQSPWYPGTGAAHEVGVGPGEGTVLNRPFPAGAGRDEVLGAFEDDLVAAMRRFEPQLVIISAGFDSRRGDPLGHFTLDDEDFADLTALVRDLADEHAEGRMISVLEGGYDLEGLASATAAHVGAML